MKLKNKIPCKECGKQANVDLSCRLLSSPAQYNAECSDCGHRFYVREPDLIVKPGEELGTLKIKKLHPDAIIPTRAHATDAGLDLYALEDAYFHDETQLVKTGIAVDIPAGYEAQVRPRSGMTLKTGLKVQLGTIDSGYTGDVGVIVDCRGSGTIGAGDKIAQLVITPIVTPAVEMVDDFDTQSERGSNGFGSTDERSDL